MRATAVLSCSRRTPVAAFAGLIVFIVPGILDPARNPAFMSLHD
ncbi:MAG TPA: hypothetical protein VHB01_08990 [Nitrosospira sp.]|nr:hypothetical protein [Nitrosospira sp.]